MRVFYIFNIKKEFKYLYEDNPSTLFNILKQIYYLEKRDLLYGKTLFNQLVNRFDKINMNNFLFIKLHQEMPYSKRGEVHYINNLYKNEISRLVIRKAYIKLEMENSFSSFIPILKENNTNLFLCDFEYSDFFWIDKAKSLV